MDNDESISVKVKVVEPTYEITFSGVRHLELQEMGDTLLTLSKQLPDGLDSGGALLLAGINKALSTTERPMSFIDYYGIVPF